MKLTVPLEHPDAVDPERFGPKAANLARLAQAGLPTPGGACIDAEAYRVQLAHLGLLEAALEAASTEDVLLARRRALELRLGLYEQPIVVPVLDAWEALRGAAGAVRSSALVEDRLGSTFAGQFESYLGIETREDYLTAVRACWAALWSVRALRYMGARGIDPARTAMAVLVQPFVAARAAGGGLSRTPGRSGFAASPVTEAGGRSIGGEMLVTATRGPGSRIAQGEVVPDRYLLDREAVLVDLEPGRAESPGCAHLPRRAAAETAPSLDRAQAQELGLLLRQTEAFFGYPVEIEWALGESGFVLLQARQLQLDTAGISAPLDSAPAGRSIRGQPAGIGRASGRACVVRCECELGRVAPGDVLVTKIAGPGLSGVLQSVAAVVTELGGSTSHLASLARERGIPMVLGASDATLRIPDGCELTVDGVLGVACWQRRSRAFEGEGRPDGLRLGLARGGAEGPGGTRRPRRSADEEAR